MYICFSVGLCDLKVMLAIINALVISFMPSSHTYSHFHIALSIVHGVNNLVNIAFTH